MTKDEALKLALVVEGFDNNDESLPLELLKPIAATLRALAQSWPDITKQRRESYQKGHNDGVAHHKQAVKAAQPDYRAVKTYHEGKPVYVAQPEQEPVAHMYADDYERMLNSETFCTVYSVAVGSPTRGETTIELYTTPPKRKWVDLTDEDVEIINGNTWDVREAARMASAKSKEKNT